MGDENRIKQCFAVQIVQHCYTGFRLDNVAQYCGNYEQCGLQNTVQSCMLCRTQNVFAAQGKARNDEIRIELHFQLLVAFVATLILNLQLPSMLTKVIVSTPPHPTPSPRIVKTSIQIRSCKKPRARPVVGEKSLQNGRPVRKVSCQHTT